MDRFYHGLTPYTPMTLPASASFSPFMTAATRSPPSAGSTAPLFLSDAASPVKLVAQSPGSAPMTRNPSGLSLAEYYARGKVNRPSLGL